MLVPVPPPCNTAMQHRCATPPCNTAMQHHHATPPCNTAMQHRHAAPPCNTASRCAFLLLSAGLSVACRVSKTKLVAYNGKLIRVEEAQPGESPNGSAFVITTQPAPELDATNLVIGRLVDGMDVVHQLTQLPTVKSNNSVFFRSAEYGFVATNVCNFLPCNGRPCIDPVACCGMLGQTFMTVKVCRSVQDGRLLQLC